MEFLGPEWTGSCFMHVPRRGGFLRSFCIPVHQTRKSMCQFVPARTRCEDRPPRRAASWGRAAGSGGRSAPWTPGRRSCPPWEQRGCRRSNSKLDLSQDRWSFIFSILKEIQYLRESEDRDPLQLCLGSSRTNPTIGASLSASRAVFGSAFRPTLHKWKTKNTEVIK